MMGARKKGSLSEDDVSLLLQRYTANTILALLQEVSQFAGVKIDWNSLVKRTTTGITSAREYQMLWRHLAYRDALLEKIEDGAEPVDDDSDLELELEAVPAASGEALSEAAACVKVLISSGLPRELGATNRTTIDASLTIKTPSEQSLRAPSDKQQLAHTACGTNITASASVQKQQPLTGTSADGLDGNGSAGSSLPVKKKRKLWTKEEDMELIAAVQRCGEGNWANILKGDFKHDRTASQLSQRWAIIRKRQALLNQGTSDKSITSTRSEERLAAQKAFSLALDMPMTGSISALLSGGAHSVAPTSSSALTAAVSEATPSSTPQLQQTANQATSQKGVAIPSNKPRTTPKKSVAPLVSSLGPNPLIQAAAFAAGGRIATPSTAASLFKAAQSKNAVHIRPRGGAISKSPVTTAKSSASANSSGPQAPNARQIRPAVTTTSVPPVNSDMAPTVPKHGVQQVQGCSGGPLSDTPAGSSLQSDTSGQLTMLEPKSVCDSQENAESKSSFSVPAIDVDELLSDDAGGADEMEVDGAEAQDHQTDLLSLTVGEDKNIVDVACDTQTVDGQIDLSSSQVNENQTADQRAVSSDSEGANNKAKETDAGGAQILAEASGLSNGESSKIRHVDNLSTQNLDVPEDKLDSKEVVTDPSCAQVEHCAVLDDMAAGSKLAVDDQAEVQA